MKESLWNQMKKLPSSKTTLFTEDEIFVLNFPEKTISNYKEVFNDNTRQRVSSI